MRFPVTWQLQTSAAPNYTIDEYWLNRVKEIANYTSANDMDVIINIHPDEPWIVPTYKR